MEPRPGGFGVGLRERTRDERLGDPLAGEGRPILRPPQPLSRIFSRTNAAA